MPSTAVSEKPEESRESSSLGGSWSQQDTEPSERSSVEPEILEHPVKSESDKEEKTPRVSMSEASDLLLPENVLHLYFSFRITKLLQR